MPRQRYWAPHCRTLPASGLNPPPPPHTQHKRNTRTEYAALLERVLGLARLELVVDLHARELRLQRLRSRCEACRDAALLCAARARAHMLSPTRASRRYPPPHL